MSRQMKGLAPTGTEDHMGEVLPVCNACRRGMLGFGDNFPWLDVLDRPFAAGGTAGGALEGGRCGAAQMGRERPADLVVLHEGSARGRESALHGGIGIVPGHLGARTLWIKGYRQGRLGPPPI